MAKSWQFLYGVNPVLAALDAQKRVFEALYLAEPLSEKSKVISKANELGINFQSVNKIEIEKYATGKQHQGVVLKASELKPQLIKDINEIGRVKEGTWICLDHITDPQNFGSILRSAFFFGVSGVIIPTRNMAPLSTAVAKVSSGAIEWLDIYQTPELFTFLLTMKASGFNIIGADLSKKAVKLKSPPTLCKKNVLVLGNEGVGISKKLQSMCDSLHYIPGGSSTIDSLNVGSAASIFLYSLLA
jgi:21S rRNA (GM2251-2'-O)-methyltransferase